MSRPRVTAVLRLLRVGTLFSPAADVVASVAVLGLPWGGPAARAVGASVGLYAAGMVLNDFADRRVDARVRPERPLPRGDLSPAFAALLGAALIAAALWLSPCRGYHAVVAALVLAYDFLLKRVDWLGAIGMATLRGLNLATALALAGVDAATGPGNGLLVAAVCYGVYIAAVTLLGSYEDRPHVPARAIAAVQAAPPLAALCGVAVVEGGLWPAPVLCALPALWFARRTARTVTFDRAAIRRSMTLLLLGTMLYTALLAGAAGRWGEAAAIAAAVAPARWIARRVALT